MATSARPVAGFTAAAWRLVQQRAVAEGAARHLLLLCTVPSVLLRRQFVCLFPFNEVKIGDTLTAHRPVFTAAAWRLVQQLARVGP